MIYSPIKLTALVNLFKLANYPGCGKGGHVPTSGPRSKTVKMRTMKKAFYDPLKSALLPGVIGAGLGSALGSANAPSGYRGEGAMRGLTSGALTGAGIGLGANFGSGLGASVGAEVAPYGWRGGSSLLGLGVGGVGGGAAGGYGGHRLSQALLNKPQWEVDEEKKQKEMQLKMLAEMSAGKTKEDMMKEILTKKSDSLGIGKGVPAGPAPTGIGKPMGDSQLGAVPPTFSGIGRNPNGPGGKMSPFQQAAANRPVVSQRIGGPQGTDGVTYGNPVVPRVATGKGPGMGQTVLDSQQGQVNQALAQNNNTTQGLGAFSTPQQEQQLSQQRNWLQGLNQKILGMRPGQAKPMPTAAP